MDFLLKGLRWVKAEKYIRGDLRIRNGIIHELGEGLAVAKREQTIHFENHYLYPGLINAHDHLEMNLYPRLGHPPYRNYKQWGQDIYKPKESPIREIEKVDIDDRLLWGGLKNLISGVTTVAHHNPWKRILASKDFPVRVLNNLGWSHSLAFGKTLRKDFLKKPGAPYVIHAAEGVDALAFEEIRQLDHLGVLQANTVLIHAIALTQTDIDLLTGRKCSVVWCPASNKFLFQKTADIQALKKVAPVALGSDSTLTGSATLLDEMRYARHTGLTTAQEIFEMVTNIPSRVFQLPALNVSEGAIADLMIAPVLHEDYFESLIQTESSHIEAVFINGQPYYGDARISDLLKLKYTFRVNGVMKKSNMDVTSLMNKLTKKVGIKILELNPLWNMMDS